MAIKKSISAKVLSGGTINKLREMSPYIYVDKHQLQRLLDKWADETSAKHMKACLIGHSNIYTIVLVSIQGCLDYCELLISQYSKEDDRYASVKETIDYLQDLTQKGYRYLNIDGQHRVKCYTDYLNSEFTITESVIDLIESKEGATIPFEIKGKYFKDMPESTQNEILNSPITIVLIEKATLQDMVDITIYTNIGEPWNDNERRIIVPSQFNRFLHVFMNDNPLLNAMFANTKNLSTDYSLIKKGDALMVAEWFGYHYNVLEGNIYNWPKDKMLDEMASIEGLSKHSKKRLNDSKSLISKLIELVNAAGDIKFERTFLDNLFILLTVLDMPSHSMNSLKKQVKINNLKKFIDWFAKVEVALRHEDEFHKDPKTGKDYIHPITGKKSTNSESFKRKCGAKKTDDIQIRSTMMMEKFYKSYDKLFASGIISLIDTTNYTKKQKLAVAIQNDWIDADGNDFTFEELMGTNSIMEGDHIDARASGNETTESNLVIRTKRANIRKSDKQILTSK
jgi:hypothetical protein